MTIAAGFMCMDGVVLCADTQETIPGYTKNSTQKLSVYYDKEFSLIITGSGDAEIIDTLAQRLTSAAVSEFTFNDFLYGEQAKRLIQEALMEFWREHLLPYPQNERPFVELLIALQCHHNRYLLKASGNTLRDLDPGVSPGADCIGSGVMLAHSLIEKLYSPFMELDDLVVVALYVIYQAKKWVDGCGGNTDLIVLTKELRIGLASSSIEIIEKVFDHFDKQLGRLLPIVANPNRSASNAAAAIKSTQKELVDCRKHLSSDQRLAEFFQDIHKQKVKQLNARKSADQQ